MVDEIPFPHQIVTSKPLTLLGQGITDTEIHFLQIKFTAIAVYLESNVVERLHSWKGKSRSELAKDDKFFEAVMAGEQRFPVWSALRDRLAAEDKYEEEEETELEKIVEFFQSKYFKKNSAITYHFPAASCTAEIMFSTEGKEDAKIGLENANVAKMIKKWYLGGTGGVSPTTTISLANNLSAKLDELIEIPKFVQAFLEVAVETYGISFEYNSTPFRSFLIMRLHMKSNKAW